MFQPETEDMLPRMAPKPSSDISNGESEAIIRPQVPEVSIIFGQQNNNLQRYVFNTIPQNQQNTNAPQQTYASWKKQMLPKVTYPSPANIIDKQLHDHSGDRTNVYPMRANSNPTINVGANANYFGVCNSRGGVDSQTYPRSLESCSKGYQLAATLQQHQPLGAQINLPNVCLGEVLTLCAGTQTDTIFEYTNNYSQHIPHETFSNFASKKDIEDVRQILDELKVEQQRMTKMLETILLGHHYQEPMKAHYRDVGVQVDCIPSDNSPYVNGDIGQNQPAPKNKFLGHLKPASNILQTPKGKPIAQSTTYRSNSPKPLKQDFLDFVPSAICQQPPSKAISVIPKSSSDTSFAMNELALKYLPNEKLAELLKELNMNSPLDTEVINTPTTIGEGNKDKFEKVQSDISNASYKYLKKYRLLPEENGNIVLNTSEGVMKNGIDNQITHYNSPHCNALNTPINQKPTPTNRCSPYAGRLPLSPLARDPSPQQTAVPQHIVNLENIKHQPKFL